MKILIMNSWPVSQISFHKKYWNILEGLLEPSLNLFTLILLGWVQVMVF